MKSPLVSVVIVTWNRPQFLAFAVEQFKAQIYKSKELIVVDDSEPGKALDLSCQPDVKVIRPAERLTVGEKLAIGFDAAQGDYVAYQDDDDWISPSYLTRQVGPLISGQGTVAATQRDLTLKLERAATWWRFKPQEARPPVAQWIGNGTADYRWWRIKDSTAVFSRAALSKGARHEKINVIEKVKFLNLMHAQGERLVTIPNQQHYVYCRHSANIWQYREDLIHERAKAPDWFPAGDLKRLMEAATAVRSPRS